MRYDMFLNDHIYLSLNFIFISSNNLTLIPTPKLSRTTRVFLPRLRAWEDIVDSFAEWRSPILSSTKSLKLFIFFDYNKYLQVGHWKIFHHCTFWNTFCQSLNYFWAKLYSSLWFRIYMEIVKVEPIWKKSRFWNKLMNYVFF